MKIEILKENLKSGLNVVERVVGKNLTLPILDNVLMSTEDSFLSLTSTNLETTMRFWVLSKIIRDGKSVVPVRVLSNFVSFLPNEKVTMEDNKQNLAVECKNFKTQINGLNPEDFPIIPELKEIMRVEIDSQKLCQGLSQVIDIPLESQTRPEISGVYFNFEKNNLKLVATDSFRLAEKSIAIKNPSPKDYSFIMPQKPAKDLMNVLSEKEGPVNVCLANNQVLFDYPMKETKHSQIQLTSRLIEGEYPNYQEIIPNKFKASSIVSKDEVLNQIKTASLFSNKINEVKVSIDSQKQEMGIFSKSPDVGESKSSSPAKVKGESLEISFNYKFLIDGLSKIKSSEVSFEASREDGPCIVRPVGDGSYLYVVMPIKSI